MPKGTPTTQDPLKEQMGPTRFGGGYQEGGTAAERQYELDQQSWKDTLAANRPNLSNPWGQQQWSRGPNGEWQLSSGFNGPMAGAQGSLQQQYASLLGQPLRGIRDVGSSEQARQDAINTSFNQARSRLDPLFAEREDAMRQQLLNQGLDPSSEAGRNEMAQFGRDRNDAYNQAMYSAIGHGDQAYNDLYRNSLMARDSDIAARNSDLGALQSYLGQMGGMNSLLNMPDFNQAMPAPLAKILESLRDSNNLRLGRESNKQQGDADAMQGLSTVMAAIAMMSDERVKQNVVRLDTEAIPGVPWATWEYKDAPGRRHFGVIAQDLERVAPDFVLEDERGTKWVDMRFLERAGK